MAIATGPKIPVMVSGASGDKFLTEGNAILRMLQVLVQPNVISIGTAGPTGSPSNGDTYVVGSTGATGAWVGKDNNVAYWSTNNPLAPGGEWEFFTPAKGWSVGNQADGNMYVYDGSVWITVPAAKVNGQTGANYDAQLSDNNNLVTMDSVSACTFTVPTNASVAFPIGAILTVVQLNTGQITLTPASGAVTINTPSSLTTRTQYSTVSLAQVAANTWLAAGDLT